MALLLIWYFGRPAGSNGELIFGESHGQGLAVGDLGSGPDDAGVRMLDDGVTAVQRGLAAWPGYERYRRLPGPAWRTGTA